MPIYDVADMMNEFNKSMSIFDNFFPFRAMPKVNQLLSEWRPTADIITTPTEYKIHAELPGVSKDNFKVMYKRYILTAKKVTVEGDTVTIRGERKEATESIENQYTRKERYYGKFVRVFTIPEEVDPQSIKANFKDGVLELNIPRKETKAEAVEVPIEEKKSQ
jgi:HSP20 family protein